MMVTQHRRKTREVTGPTPHSVAIFARPANKIPPEHLVLERRKQENARAESEALIKYTKMSDLKNDWEKHTNKRIQHNTVKRRVNDLLQAKEFSVEDRRDRLRDLLAREEDAYAAEIAGKEETVLERQANMRARAKALKEKREAERQEFVQEKLDQQWRNQCEELRSTMSKRHQDEVSAERMDQLRVKEEEKLRAAEEEKIYADMWYADMAAKARREEEDTKRQMEGNLQTLAVLQKQMAALAEQKEEEKKLIEEEAALLREQAALRKLEEQQLLEDKRRKQAETRQMYTDSLRLKREKEAKELQEQLAFDMKILEQLLEESRNEAMEQSRRKKELKEEDARYRAYLKQLKAEEAAHEKELDRMCDLEVEKMWDKRIKQWRLEKAARKALLAEVMASRRIQLQDKLRANEIAQEEKAREREALLAQIEENKRLDREAADARHQKEVSHENDLLGQIDYNRRQAQKQQSEEERMWQAQREAELEYRRKLEDALANPQDPHMHPMRRRATLSANRLNGGGLPGLSIKGSALNG